MPQLTAVQKEKTRENWIHGEYPPAFLRETAEEMRKVNKDYCSCRPGENCARCFVCGGDGHTCPAPSNSDVMVELCARCAVDDKDESLIVAVVPRVIVEAPVVIGPVKEDHEIFPPAPVVEAPSEALQAPPSEVVPPIDAPAPVEQEAVKTDV